MFEHSKVQYSKGVAHVACAQTVNGADAAAQQRVHLLFSDCWTGDRDLAKLAMTFRIRYLTCGNVSFWGDAWGAVVPKIHANNTEAQVDRGEDHTASWPWPRTQGTGAGATSRVQANCKTKEGRYCGARSGCAINSKSCRTGCCTSRRLEALVTT